MGLTFSWYALTGFLFPLPHSVKGPELINMYVGQSEENVRNGEQMHPAPACGRMGLFCAAGRKKVVLKPLFPAPTCICQTGYKPSCLLHPVLPQIPLLLSLLLLFLCLLFLMGQQPVRDTVEPQGTSGWVLPVRAPTEPLSQEQLVMMRQWAAGFHPQLFSAGVVAGPVAVDCSSTSSSPFVLSPPSVCQSQGSCSLHYIL